MSFIAEAFVRVRPDVSGFKQMTLTGVEKEMQGVRRASDQMSTAVSKASHEHVGLSRSSRTAEKDMSHLTRGVVAGSGAFHGFARQLAFASAGFIGARGFVELVRNSVKEASSLEQQMSRTDTVFLVSAKSIKAWSKTSVDSLGLGQAAALEAANTIGTLLKNVGETPQAAAGMSKSFVQLAVDMAAFKKVEPDVALNALESALQGRTRSLKQFGLVIDNASIKAEAFSSGIAKTSVDLGKVKDAQMKVAIAQERVNEATTKYGPTSVAARSATLGLDAAHRGLEKAIAGSGGQLTAQQKALSVYSLVMKQTKDQQGAFARNSDDLAIIQRKLHANLQEVEIQIGQVLLPVVKQYAQELDNWITKERENGSIQRATRSAVNLLKDAISIATPVVKFLGNAFKNLSDAVGGNANALKVLGAAWLAWKAKALISWSAVAAFKFGALIANVAEVGTAATAVATATEISAASQVVSWKLVQGAMIPVLAEETAIGDTAVIQAGKVGILQTALLRLGGASVLGALGALTVAIGAAFAAGQIDTPGGYNDNTPTDIAGRPTHRGKEGVTVQVGGDASNGSSITFGKDGKITLNTQNGPISGSKDITLAQAAKDLGISVKELKAYLSGKPLPSTGGNESDPTGKFTSNAARNASALSTGRAKMLAFARNALGAPYLWGGSGPGGFDCSGLVQWAFANGLNVSIPRTTYDQVKMGRQTATGYGGSVSSGSLHVGDVVFTQYGEKGKAGPGHEGLVVGFDGSGNAIIESAPGKGGHVHTGSLASFTSGGSFTARNLLGKPDTTTTTTTTDPTTGLPVVTANPKPKKFGKPSLLPDALAKAIAADADKAANATGSAAAAWLGREQAALERAHAILEAKLKGASGKEAGRINAEISQVDSRLRSIAGSLAASAVPQSLKDAISKASENARTSTGKIAAHWLEVEIAELERARADVASKLASATGRERALLAAQLTQIDNKIRAANKAVTDNIAAQDKVIAAALKKRAEAIKQTFQQPIADAKSQVGSMWSRLSSGILGQFEAQTQRWTTAFEQASQDYIDKVLGPKFFQGALTPLEQRLSDMQVADQAKQYTDAVTAAKDRLAADAAQSSTSLSSLQNAANVAQHAYDRAKAARASHATLVARQAALDAANAALKRGLAGGTNAQTAADQQTLDAAQRQLDEYNLAADAARERAQADKDYAEATRQYLADRASQEQAYVDSRNVDEMRLSDQLDTFGKGLEDGTSNMSDLATLLGSAGLGGVVAQLNDPNTGIGYEFSALGSAASALTQVLLDEKNKLLGVTSPSPTTRPDDRPGPRGADPAVVDAVGSLQQDQLHHHAATIEEAQAQTALLAMIAAKVSSGTGIAVQVRR